jgi:hypothetical protein
VEVDLFCATFFSEGKDLKSFLSLHFFEQVFYRNIFLIFLFEFLFEILFEFLFEFLFIFLKDIND